MAVRFSAGNAHLTYTGTLPAIATTGITITLWAYLSVDRNDYSNLSRLVGSSGSISALETEANGTQISSFGAGGSLNSGYDLTVGAWHRLAVTISPTGVLKLYAALETGSTTVATGSTGAATGTSFTIGGRADNPFAEWFNGRIACERIWAAVLTQTEIEAEWGLDAAVRTADLFADWPLSGASDLNDASGNGRHLTAGAVAVTTEDGPPVESAPTEVVGDVAQAAETDTATPLARAKLRGVAQPVEVNLAQPLGRAKVRAIGQAGETSSATTLTHWHVVTVGQAAELGAAQPLGRAKAVPLGAAIEGSNARPFTRVKTRGVAAAVELSTAAAVTARHILRVTVGQAVEEALAGAWGRVKVRALGRAAELDRAHPVTQAGKVIPPTVLGARHHAATLTAAHRGRSRLGARHG